MGNVGIGTTNPQSKLDITGRIIQRGPTANNLNYYLKTNGDDLWPEDVQGSLSPGILVGPALGMDWGAYGPGDGSSLRLFAHNGAKINFSRTNFNPTSHFDFETLMQIDTYDGTVHIGGDYGGDGERLTVGGNVRFSGALMPAGAAGTAGQVLTSAGAGVAPTWVNAAATPTEPWFNAATGTGANANTQNIYQMGNVGIGRTNPESQLDVQGRIVQRGPIGFSLGTYMHTNAGNSWEDSGELFPGLLFQNSSFRINGIDAGFGGQDRTRTRIFSSQEISFSKVSPNPTSQADFIDLMLITEAGNVGIGVGQQGVVRSRLVVRGLPIYADNNAAKVALGSVLDGYKDAIGAFYHNGDGILRVVF
jgi:hypothetical protein